VQSFAVGGVGDAAQRDMFTAPVQWLCRTLLLAVTVYSSTVPTPRGSPSDGDGPRVGKAARVSLDAGEVRRAPAAHLAALLLSSPPLRT
jgi:hypothetical protein